MPSSPGVADGWTLTPRARTDLADIWRFGAQRWSIQQADRYEDGLFRTFDLLAAQPRLARARPEISQGIRVHPYDAHLLFYRIADDGIEIVRIVHARQDLLAALD